MLNLSRREKFQFNFVHATNMSRVHYWQIYYGVQIRIDAMMLH